MIFAKGATSQSVDVAVYDNAGLPVTGLVAATFPTVKYSLAGGNADATISLSDLASLGASYSSGGLYERGEGAYRLDLPNAALATAGHVTLRGEAANKRLVCPVIDVTTTAADLAAISGYAVELIPCNTTTAGTTVRILAKVRKGGAMVAVYTIDPTATLALAVREQGEGADLFTIGATTVGSDHLFALSQNSPNYTADRNYKYTATLVVLGVTYTDVDVIPTLG